jgi:hypothetical protein
MNMARGKSADAVKFLLRIQPELLKRVEKLAARNNTSVTQQIINMLEGHEATMLLQTAHIFEPIIYRAVESALASERVAARMAKIFEPIMHRAVEYGMATATKMVLGVLKDSARPPETEMERRLRELEKFMGRDTEEAPDRDEK